MIKMKNRRKLRKGDAWGIVLEILGPMPGGTGNRVKIAWQGKNIGTMRTDILEIVK
tara:strand:+ start:217 stop:384 length:168 start_codon:yes stop_codon:yes gene_type:complete